MRFTLSVVSKIQISRSSANPLSFSLSLPLFLMLSLPSWTDCVFPCCHFPLSVVSHYIQSAETFLFHFSHSSLALSVTSLPPPAHSAVAVSFPLISLLDVLLSLWLHTKGRGWKPIPEGGSTNCTLWQQLSV